MPDHKVMTTEGILQGKFISCELCILCATNLSKQGYIIFLGQFCWVGVSSIEKLMSG